MKFLANLSIRSKIAGIVLVATLLSLGTGFALVIFNNMRLFEEDLRSVTDRITRVTGDFSAVNLYFEMLAENRPEGIGALLRWTHHF